MKINGLYDQQLLGVQKKSGNRHFIRMANDKIKRKKEEDENQSRSKKATLNNMKVTNKMSRKLFSLMELNKRTKQCDQSVVICIFSTRESYMHL